MTTRSISYRGDSSTSSRLTRTTARLLLLPLLATETLWGPTVLVQALSMPTPPSSKTTSSSCPFEAIIFDIDGTLSDSFQLGFDATNKVLERHNMAPITADVYHDHTRYSTPDRLARHAGLRPGDDDYAKVGQALGQEFDDLYIGLVTVETSGFFDGIRDLLERIPDSVRLGALTNAAVAYAHAVLQVNSPPHVDDGSSSSSSCLYDRFGSIRGADNVPVPKPAPDGLRTVCRDLGVTPASCVYVGDSPTDAQAARAAGMYAVGVTWGSHAAASLAQAPFDVLCTTVQELQEVLLVVGATQQEATTR